jgi:hypothetical protein
MESNHLVPEIGLRRRMEKDRVIWRFEAESPCDYDFTQMKRWE